MKAYQLFSLLVVAALLNSCSSDHLPSAEAAEEATASFATADKKEINPLTDFTIEKRHFSTELQTFMSKARNDDRFADLSIRFEQAEWTEVIYVSIEKRTDLVKVPLNEGNAYMTAKWCEDFVAKNPNKSLVVKYFRSRDKYYTWTLTGMSGEDC